MDDPRATLRNGRFVLLEPIGEGAQGQTFDAIDEQPRLGQARKVAIKRFNVRGATSWKDVELAEREASVLKSLSHPKLPAYVDHFEEDGSLYLVMEKIEGETLASHRKRGATLSESDVVRLLRDASDVLDYLHRRAPPVIHRDLKPGNVIRRPDGSFAFVDFGAVRDKLRPKGGSTIVGTFGYMAPEQVQGRALPASDVYAIGATAVAMLSGSEPEELPHRGLTINVRQALRGQTSDRLVSALERMLDADPDRRASRIAPLLARLDRVRPEVSSSKADDAARRDVWDRRANRYARLAERRARHEARRAELVARRIAGWRVRRGHFLPWPVRLLFAVVFTLGILAVSLATQVFVPVVLTVLSLFVARRALIAAAEAVRNAGGIAVDGMRASRSWFFDDTIPLESEQAAEPRMRVNADASSPEHDQTKKPRIAEVDGRSETDDDAAPKPPNASER